MALDTFMSYPYRFRWREVQEFMPHDDELVDDTIEVLPPLFSMAKPKLGPEIS